MVACAAGGDAEAPAVSLRATGWVTLVDHTHGLVVRYPRDWSRSEWSLTPFLADPREILSLGTLALRPNGPEVCAQFPVRAVEDLGTRDVLISLQERQIHTQPDGAPRPAHFRLERHSGGELSDCVPAPVRARHAREYWLSFSDARRSFYLLVVLGRSVSPRTRQDTLKVLDSLRFTSIAANSESPPTTGERGGRRQRSHPVWSGLCGRA